MIARLRSNPHWLILGLVLVLAAAARFYMLDAQSLWYDEGNSARIAERSLRLIIEGAAGDIHPPLYYVALKYWRAAFGEGEAALRSLSVACSTLTVLFAYLIGRDLFGRRTGLIAACLLAGMPFAIYYAQEARMYALLALCAAASTWALIRIENSKSKIEKAAPGFLNFQFSIFNSLFVLATAAGLWTHYAYPFVMIAQGVACLACAILDKSGRGSKRFGRYILLSPIAVALYLPWLPVAIRQVTGWGVERLDYRLDAAAAEIYRALVVGITLPAGEAWLPAVLFGGVGLIGLIAGGRALLSARLALLSLIALPSVLLLILGLYREAYLKFLLVSVLPLCALTAHGIAEIGDWGSKIAHRVSLPSLTSNLLSAAGALVLVASVSPSLSNLYRNPAYARDDYRGIHRLISANARPDDAVLFLAPNQWEVFTYYQRDDRNLFPLTYRPASYDAVARQMQAIAATHRRLFALYFAERDADPEGWYEFWMSGNLYKVHERWVGNIRLAVYDSGSGRDAWPAADGATFGDAIELVEARGRWGQVRAGDVVPVELTWRALHRPTQRYKVFVHIGPDDGPPIAQHDSEPVAGYRPTDGWLPDERIADRRGAWIGPDAPGGDYGVFIGLYDPQTGARLPITRHGQPLGDRLKIGTVTIR
ncbi:MAG: glycosyltransferase family 39 protein [Anaerolineae bacterium]|nr:glycosyltransferase family 39 protein [Anaerolineae bacterium]